MARRRSSWEKRYRAILAVVVETVAAFLGLYIMFKAINSKMDRPWEYATALGMMGIPLANSFQNFVTYLGQLLDELKAGRETLSSEQKPTQKPGQSQRRGDTNPSPRKRRDNDR